MTFRDGVSISPSSAEQCKTRVVVAYSSERRAHTPTATHGPIVVFVGYAEQPVDGQVFMLYCPGRCDPARPGPFLPSLPSLSLYSLKASEMSSSSLTVYPHLPPTTNILDSQQRTRLMRTTRKLGSLLGTTPCLLENDTSFAMLPLGRTTSRALKRQGSIFAHRQISSLSVASSSTSTASLAHRPCPSVSSIVLSQTTDSLSPNPPDLSTIRGRRLGDRLPQLCLRVDTVPVSPTDERLAPPPSPLPSPRTPVTPTVPDVAEIHRKRMAKLAHHLGENIPVELVLPAQPGSKPATAPQGRPQCRPQRRRSQSVQVMRTQVVVGDIRPSTRQDWVGEWNRSNIGDVQKELRKLKIG